jgi:transposase
MKIYKITEASEYLGVSINTIKTLANNGKAERVLQRKTVRYLKGKTIVILYR